MLLRFRLHLGLLTSLRGPRNGTHLYEEENKPQWW